MSICFSDGLTNSTVFTFGFILLNHLTVDYHNIHLHLQTLEINRETSGFSRQILSAHPPTIPLAPVMITLFSLIFDFSVDYSIFPKN
jgi:hypothetical protein